MSEGLSAGAVTYSYGGRPAVRDVTLSLHRGESVALAGPNGSGKTTLMRLLTGALRPSTGSVALDGSEVRRLGARELARRVAVVPQHLDPHLLFTVREIVAMGRTSYIGLFGAPSQTDREAVDRALDATRTAELARRMFTALSGGEQQRVMLATALAQEADFLLLDEPTVHLDLHHQHELLELLAHLHGVREIGILAVLHDLNLASLYFSRLAVMSGGSLVAEGPPSEIVGREETLAVFRAPLLVVRHPQAGVPQVLLDRGHVD